MALSDNAIIEAMDRYGHTRTTDPDKKEARNLHTRDLSSVTLSDRPVQDSIRSYQEWFKDDLNEIAKEQKRKITPSADGDPGPAFHELLKRHLQGGRCGCPEFGRDADDPLFNKEEAN